MSDSIEFEIEIIPSNWERGAYAKACLAAINAGKRSFTYGGAEFVAREWEEGAKLPDHWAVVLNGLDAPLPDVFRNSLVPDMVIATCTRGIEELRPVAGDYDGHKFGYPRADCRIDPDGVMNGGEPIAYANGSDYGDVTRLLRRVVAGKLTPTPFGAH